METSIKKEYATPVTLVLEVDLSNNVLQNSGGQQSLQNLNLQLPNGYGWANEI